MANLTQQQTDRRLAAVRGRMAAEKLDALLVLDAANLRWLTGYTGEGVSALVTRRWAGILAGFRNVDRAGRQTVGYEIVNAKGRPHAWREEIRRRRVKAVGLGAGEILLTSMDCDGTLAGYDLEITRAISRAVPVPVIASGGGGKPVHFRDAVTLGEADAVLAASVFHDNKIPIPQLKRYLEGQQIPVRRTYGD